MVLISCTKSGIGGIIISECKVLYIFTAKFFQLDNLFALHSIKRVWFIDGRNIQRSYVFTSKMQTNNIFIEYFTIDTLPEEDEGPDEDIESEDFNDDESEPEYGSRLSVVMKHNNKYYEFLMYYDTFEIGVPIMLLQTILFLVKLIEETAPDLLVEYLTSLATDPLIPHEIADKSFRNAANKMIKLKLQTIHSLIREGNADLN